MTKFEMVFEYIKRNPKAKNEDICRNLKMDSELVRNYIKRLKAKGYIIDTRENGERTLEVINEMRKEKGYANKREYYEEMIEIYMEDFRLATTFDDRLRVGREIRLLIEKI